MRHKAHHEEEDRPMSSADAEKGLNNKVTGNGKFSLADDSTGYQKIFESAIDAMIIHEVHSPKILEVNEKTVKLYGYTRDELLSIDITDLMEGASLYRSEEIDEIKRRIDSGEELVFEWKGKKKNGELFWAEVSSKRILIAGRDLVVVFVKDITWQKEIEEELKKSEAKYRRLAENSPDMLFRISLPLRHFEYVSPVVTTILGYSPHDFYINPDLLESAVHTDWRSYFKTKWGAILNGESSENLVYQIVDQNGLIKWVSQRNVLIKDNGRGLVGVEGVISDITASKEAEEALRKEEARYKAIIQASTDGFLLMDLDGKILETNKAYCEMSGYTSDEVCTRFVYDLDEVEDQRATKEHIEKKTTKRSERFEARHIRKDGSVYDVEVSSRYLPIDGGRLVSFIRDISDVKKAERDKATLESRLLQAQKLESIGRLAGGVAHDFNNMLSVIIGYAEQIRVGVKSGDSFYDSVVQIIAAARRSSDITSQLLAFARKQTISPRKLDLNASLSKMGTMLKRLIGEDIELSVQLAEDKCYIMMDPSQVDQVIINLCVNARDAINGVGKIVLNTEEVYLDSRYCKQNPGAISGNFVRLEVHDNGSGMDEETLLNLFEPFFTTKEAEQGTGLGLATVYGIIQQNGGFVNVESAPGEGSTFRLFFPCFEESDGVCEEKGDGAELSAGSETVLLVEDEPAVLNMTKTILENLGYNVLATLNPVEAITLAENHCETIDLLLTDVVMPQMNGRELAEMLQEKHPHLKIIFMSGYTANVLAPHGVLESGLNFIQKPFSINDLSVKVREVLEKDE